jgi:ZIP family zinc transporter
MPEMTGSGVAIAVGALIDGIPESIAIGLSILHGGEVSMATVAAIFLSNLPEGLSSSAGMRKARRSAAYVFGVWTAIAIACGLASLAGYAVFGAFSPFIVTVRTAVAAGGMLTMIVDTMIPEAVAEAHDWVRRFVVLGFLISFTLTKINS